MNVNDVYGTLYSPADGTIDPAGYCNALTRGATKRGAKVRSRDPIGYLSQDVFDKFSVLPPGFAEMFGEWYPDLCG